MIEIGKKYKLKKIKAPFTMVNDEKEYKILDVQNNFVTCENTDTHERFVFKDDMFITDPEDDVYGELTQVVECGAAAACCPAATAGAGTGGAMGAATPAPALGHVLSNNFAGVKVNGIPVAGKSNKKKKKKKSKKNEAVEVDSTLLTIAEVIEMVDETFAPDAELYAYEKGKRYNLLVKVCYTDPEARVLVHTVEINYLDPITDDVLDTEITEDLSIGEVIDTLEFVYNDCKRGKVDEDLVDDIEDVLDTEMERVSNFKEKYEEIADVLAKELDKMNFIYADTEDIIYKKEGECKYLIKFDNENGILKFKATKEDKTIYENEWKLQEGEDISPIFEEIRKIYTEYGI